MAFHVMPRNENNAALKWVRGKLLKRQSSPVPVRRLSAQRLSISFILFIIIYSFYYSICNGSCTAKTNLNLDDLNLILKLKTQFATNCLVSDSYLCNCASSLSIPSLWQADDGAEARAADSRREERELWSMAVAGLGEADVVFRFLQHSPVRRSGPECELDRDSWTLRGRVSRKIRWSGVEWRTISSPFSLSGQSLEVSYLQSG